MVIHYMDNCGNSRANTCAQTPLGGMVVFIRFRTNPGLFGLLVIHDTRPNRLAPAGDKPFKLLTPQLPTVGCWPAVAMTGNGELGQYGLLCFTGSAVPRHTSLPPPRWSQLGSPNKKPKIMIPKRLQNHSKIRTVLECSKQFVS